MRITLYRVFTAFAAVLCLSVTAVAANVPKGDMTISIREEQKITENKTRIINGLQLELLKRGYNGKLSLVPSDSLPVENKGNVVSVIILKSSWDKQKAFSIPFILNRYRTVFALRLLVRISSGDGKQSIEEINADSKSAVEAQVMMNDKHDPDLLKEQSERLTIEDDTYAQAIKKLVDKLGGKL
jgi:hypothetical protein